MKSAIKVAVHPVTKEVITVNVKKPEFGTIRLDQESISMENGFLNKLKRSAFINGKIEDLKLLNYKEGQILAGQIIRKESRKIMFDNQNPKINPTTKQIHLIDGQPVYFKDYYTEDMSAKDELIKSVTNNISVSNQELVS